MIIYLQELSHLLGNLHDMMFSSGSFSQTLTFIYTQNLRMEKHSQVF